MVEDVAQVVGSPLPMQRAYGEFRRKIGTVSHVIGGLYQRVVVSELIMGIMGRIVGNGRRKARRGFVKLGRDHEYRVSGHEFGGKTD